MAFGSSIKKLREQAGISVDKLTEKIGVKAARWRKWEEKDFDPRDEDQAKIEAFFGISLSEIAELSDIKKFLKVPNQMIPEDRPTLPPAGVEELTPGQILTILARANDKYAETLALQARILDRIENKMALESTQGQIQSNLSDVLQVVNKLSVGQNVVSTRLLKEIQALQKNRPSLAIDRKKAGNDSD